MNVCFPLARRRAMLTRYHENNHSVPNSNALTMLRPVTWLDSFIERSSADEGICSTCMCVFGGGEKAVL